MASQLMEDHGRYRQTTPVSMQLQSWGAILDHWPQRKDFWPTQKYASLSRMMAGLKLLTKKIIWALMLSRYHFFYLFARFNISEYTVLFFKSNKINFVFDRITNGLGMTTLTWYRWRHGISMKMTLVEPCSRTYQRMTSTTCVEMEDFL